MGAINQVEASNFLSIFASLTVNDPPEPTHTGTPAGVSG